MCSLIRGRSRRDRWKMGRGTHSRATRPPGGVAGIAVKDLARRLTAEALLSKKEANRRTKGRAGERAGKQAGRQPRQTGRLTDRRTDRRTGRQLARFCAPAPQPITLSVATPAPSPRWPCAKKVSASLSENGNKVLLANLLPFVRMMAKGFTALGQSGAPSAFSANDLPQGPNFTHEQEHRRQRRRYRHARAHTHTDLHNEFCTKVFAHMAFQLFSSSRGEEEKDKIFILTFSSSPPLPLPLPSSPLPRLFPSLSQENHLCPISCSVAGN